MASLALPVYFSIGSFRLSPNRVVLVLAFLPVLVLWLTGKSGRFRTADFLLLGCAGWLGLSILATEGAGRLEFIGITMIEMLGPYLIGRCFIRSEADYVGVLRILRWIVILLLPAAILESVAGIRVFTRLFDPVFSVFPWSGEEPRAGLYRAQTVFEHPILYGVFTGFLFAPLYNAALGRGRSWIGAGIFAAPAGFATFFALSAGAFLGLFVQLLMMGWEFMTRHIPKRWMLLGGLAALAYVMVDLLSNRTPFEVFISYLTFNSHTAYWRVLIFNFGMENVWANPLFGIGLGDWERPSWMHSASVDNFWLLLAMRYGIPGFVLFAAVYFSVLAGLAKARPEARSTRLHRDGLAFSLIGLGISLCTVHLWNATFVFMMFMLGAGAWISEKPSGTPMKNRGPDAFPNEAGRIKSSRGR